MICYLFPEPIYFLFTSGVPTLLYYSYIPITIVVLFVGLYVFLQSRHALLNQLFLGIALLFSFWTASVLIEWTNIHSDLILFVWNFQGIIFASIAVCCIYFIYVFLEKKDISTGLKKIFLALLAPIFVLTPSYFLSGFNITTCDAFQFQSNLFQIYYIGLGILAMIWIMVLFIRSYHAAEANFKKQIYLMGFGIESFLFLFFIWTNLTYYLSEINALPNSQLEMFGMFGIVIFIVYIAILMVRFKTFNTKTFAAQVLVFALVALVGSQFFYVTDFYSIIVTSITLVVTGVIGIYLVRSVKNEIEARESLDIVNKQQVTLLHFISHEIKGYLTKSEAGFAAISQGDFGPVSPEIATMANSALVDVRKGVRTVMDILDASNLKQGTVAYKKAVFDLKDVVKDVVDHLHPAIEEKHLTVNMSFAWEIPCKVNGDEEKIRDHVVRNLVDNAIKYTPAGSITVEVLRVGAIVRFSVLDSGVGITDEDKARLFTEGGHGKDSVKVNVHSTGYGLYIAKQVVEASGGKIWAESEGQGKGSKFVVELPAA